MRANLHSSHPWHGVELDTRSPNYVKAFIEITPSDTVKYEVDKPSGILRLDRPQKFSNIVPALYGFIPRTYCGSKVASFAQTSKTKDARHGDGDPLDILVLSSHVILHGNILVSAKPIGGIRLIDSQEVDDKIIAVLEGDSVYGSLNDVSELSQETRDRFEHYFLTYKNLPNQPPTCSIEGVYGYHHAQKVILESIQDYGDLCSTTE